MTFKKGDILQQIVSYSNGVGYVFDIVIVVEDRSNHYSSPTLEVRYRKHNCTLMVQPNHFVLITEENL